MEQDLTLGLMRKQYQKATLQFCDWMKFTYSFLKTIL